MARKSKEEKAFDSMIERACAQACNGIQINIMDLSKVDRKAREIAKANGNMAQELRVFVESIRAN